MASDMNSHSSDKKGSSRFSRLLGGKREKSLERSERSDRPQASTMPIESGYASSDTPSARPNNMHDSSTTDIVPAERDSEIADIDKGRNLGLRPTTGEVFDRDTGEMVTVVTTTTTTTTTTSRKPGQHDARPEVSQDVQRDVQQSTPGQLEQPAAKQIEPRPTHMQTSTTPSVNTGLSEMPATNERSTNAAPMQSSTVGDQPISRPTTSGSPPLPMKSDKRVSQDYRSPAQRYPEHENIAPPPTNAYGDVPSSPSSRPNNNFSYPSRSRNSMEPEALTTTNQPQQHSKSTMADLRAAAKGIHGVGETLRGTLNSTIDQNFPRSNMNKAAAANAKNEGVLSKGRTEMQHVNTGRNAPSTAQRSETDAAAPGGMYHPNNTPSTVQYSDNNPTNTSGTYGADNRSGVAGALQHSDTNPTASGGMHHNDNRSGVPGAMQHSDTNPMASGGMQHNDNRSDVPGMTQHRDTRSNVPMGATTSSGVPDQLYDSPPTGQPHQSTYENQTASSDDRERQKAKSIGKLFKRKPVNKEGGGELRDPSSRKYY